MQSFTSFLLRLPMFFIVLFCLMPGAASAATAIVKSPESYVGDVVYRSSSGVTQRMDAAQNKLTALHFWATWCVPCVKELPHINEMQKKYSSRGFEFIALSLDVENPDTAKQFYQDNNIDALELFFDSGMTAFRQLNVKVVPTTIFIDSYGKEIARAEGALHSGNAEVDRFIRSQTSE